MRCWTCGAEAEGICRFCGRATCKVHAQTKAFLFEAWDEDGSLRALGLEDALHCGICRPKPEPINADFLKRSKR